MFKNIKQSHYHESLFKPQLLGYFFSTNQKMTFRNPIEEH